MKKIVILNGSPRKKGFTNALIAQFSGDVVVLDLYRKQVRPCVDCGACLTGTCPFNLRDDVDEIWKIMQDADCVVLASPIYFAGFPAPLKALIDRSQQFFMNRANNRTRCFPNRRQGFLLLAAGQDDVANIASCKQSADLFFRCMNADFVDCYCLTNTDDLQDCPPIDPHFLAQIEF